MFKIMQDNSQIQVKLRRYQNMLIISGTGTIVFGIWSILKIIINYSTDIGSLIHLFDNVETGALFRVIAYFFFALMISTDLGLRLIIGMSARSEGMGRKRRYVYIILAGILAFISAVLFLILIVRLILSGNILTTIVSLFVEGTSLFALIELIISAIMVKKLTREAGRQPVEAAVRG